MYQVRMTGLQQIQCLLALTFSAAWNSAGTLNNYITRYLPVNGAKINFVSNWDKNGVYSLWDDAIPLLLLTPNKHTNANALP